MGEFDEITKTTAERKRRGFNLRGFFSLLLFTSFSLLLLTGTILYVTPQGRVAHWTGWTILGLDKEEWSAIHITLALLVLIASGFHLYYNWSIFWGYITRKAQRTLNLKWEVALAVVLCVITVSGTLYDVPPFGTIIQWNDDIKDYWEARSAAPPVPHAEDLSIEELASTVDMPLEEVIALLKDAGVEVDDASVKVNDVAIAHGTVPSELFAVIRPESRGVVGGGGHGVGRGGGGYGSSGRGRGQGAGQGRSLGSGQDSTLGEGLGLGRITVLQCCESRGVSLAQGLERLEEAGIVATGSETLKAIADRSGKRPTEIREIIGGDW